MATPCGILRVARGRALGGNLVVEYANDDESVWEDVESGHPAGTYLVPVAGASYTNWLYASTVPTADAGVWDVDDPATGASFSAGASPPITGIGVTQISVALIPPTEDTESTIHGTVATGSIPDDGSGTMTISAYLRADGGGTIPYIAFTIGIIAALNGGSLLLGGAAIGLLIDSGAESVGAGWYRVWIVVPNGSDVFQVYVGNAFNSGGSPVVAWPYNFQISGAVSVAGVQVTNGSAILPLIETTTEPVSGGSVGVGWLIVGLPAGVYDVAVERTGGTDDYEDQLVDDGTWLVPGATDDIVSVTFTAA